MKKRLLIVVFIYLNMLTISMAQVKPPVAYPPVPTVNQLKWQAMEYYAFLHFSLNTYTDQSWGYGNEDINLFNPKELDCRQWARICKNSGMKGIILTAKHHSGFCLWPSKYTEYSVKNAPWKNGKGDIVRELADACKEYGLKLGIYVSPWDRNHRDYGKPEYITYFRNQITELLTNYGPIFEIWFDGANGGSGYYGGANETRTIDRTTYYDWSNTYKMIRKLQPNIVIWNDGGDRGDLRWVGTEGGAVGETNWSLLNATGEVTWNMLHFGLENGNSWVPGEVNTSIRPEWFYHPSEDSKVKTVPQLTDTYYNSIGRNGTLLLNFPIAPNGLIHKIDEKAALEFAQVIKESFDENLAAKAKVKSSSVRGMDKNYRAEMVIDDNANTYWATDDSITTGSITIEFNKPTPVNRFLAQEYITLGQRVKAFTVEALIDGNWKEVAKGTTIGYKRIVRFPGVLATQIRFTILESKSCPVISAIGVFNAPVFLKPPTITRNQAGEIGIRADDIGPLLYYTLDGSQPSQASTQYLGPVKTEGKLEVKAIAFDPSTGKSSPVSTEKFDLPKSNWKILNTNDSNAYLILDGDTKTGWHQPKNKKMPVDLTIDLGSVQALSGFRYFPDQNMWEPGCITQYEFYISLNNEDWELVSRGEFPNIKNNPLWQLKTFATANARYIKFRALKNTEGNDETSYTEVEIITN